MAGRDDLPRETLPIPDRPYDGPVGEAAEDLDHLITPEDRLRIAMTRQ